MIYKHQIENLSEDELAYLFFCINSEWNLFYQIEFNFKYIFYFKEQAIIFLLNKYKNNLKDEYINTPDSIINKMFLTY